MKSIILVLPMLFFFVVYYLHIFLDFLLLTKENKKTNSKHTENIQSYYNHFPKFYRESKNLWLRNFFVLHPFYFIFVQRI